jgi:hypothetical protein
MACKSKIFSIVSSQIYVWKAYRIRFRWASMQLQSLCEMKTDDAIRERLGRLPPKLEDLYLSIYEKCRNYPAEADRRISKIALALLLGAQRTLSSAEFLDIMSMTPDGHLDNISKDQVLDICCNLVVFDGTLDTFRFAHLSVREFLEKQPEYAITSVHSIIAEICLHQLMAVVQYYAIKNSLIYPTFHWATHCELAGLRRCDPPLRDLLRRFMSNESDLNSPFVKWIYMLDYNSMRDEGREVEEKLRDTRAKSVRTLFIACAFNFYEVVRDQLTTQDLSCNILNYDYQTPLFVAMKHGSYEVISEILKKDLTQITEEVVKAAAGHSDSGEGVMRLLFDRCGTGVPITEEVVKAAAMNSGSGEGVMRVLFDRCGTGVPITEEVVKTAAGSGEGVMRLLFDRCGTSLPVTEEVVKIVAGNSSSGEGVMRLLFDQRGTDVPVTEEVVKIVAGNSSNGEGIMRLLFDRCGTSLPVTEEVVKAAAENSDSGESVMRLLFDQCGTSLPVTEEVVKAAAGKYHSNEGVMRLLFDRCGTSLPVTEEVVKAAAGNSDNGESVMRLLFDRRGTGVPVTEEVAMAAARNSGSGLRVMGLLFDRRGADVSITEEVIKAGTWDYYSNTINWLQAWQCKDPLKSGDIVCTV